MENTHDYRDTNPFILLFGAILFCSILGFGVRLQLSIDEAFQPVERGMPFLIRYSVFDYLGEETQLVVSLDRETAFSGDFDAFESLVSSQTIKPFQELGIIDQEVRDGVITGSIICAGTLIGTHRLEVLASEAETFIASQSGEITVLENNRLRQALLERWQKKSQKDHFGVTLLWEDAVFYNEQYAFTIIAAKNVSAPEDWALSGFFYYTPSLSQAESLWYTVYLAEQLGQETFIAKMADVVVNPNPILEEQTKVKIYHPYLQWTDANGNEIEDLSYEDEYQSVLYQKPNDTSFFPSEPILLKTWEGTPAMRVGEIGTVRLSVESRSLFIGSTFKLISTPSTATEITLRRSRITERQGIRRIDRTFHYEYDFLPASHATYTLTLEPFPYTVTKTGDKQVFSPDPLTIVVQERENDPVFTGIINPLKPLREDRTRVKNRQQFDKGISFAKEGNWAQAEGIFSRLALEEPLSDDIFYNLGWVAYYLDEIGLSQLAFYRASMLDNAEDTQYNIRFIETAKNLSGRPLKAVVRIRAQTQKWLLALGIATVSPLLAALAVRMARRSLTGRFKRAPLMKKRNRIFLTYLAIAGTSCSIAYCANGIREITYERQTVVMFDSLAYAGPSFSYPVIGTVKKGNVGKRIAEESGFSYIEYIALSSQETPLSGSLTPSIRYWIPFENQEIILNSLFTE